MACGVRVGALFPGSRQGSNLVGAVRITSTVLSRIGFTASRSAIREIWSGSRRGAQINKTLAAFTKDIVKKERCRERSTRIPHHADVQEQYFLFGGGSRVQEEIYSDSVAGEQRQPVPRRARAGNAPQYSEPHNFRVED